MVIKYNVYYLPTCKCRGEGKSSLSVTVITWAEDIVDENSSKDVTIFAMISEAMRYCYFISDLPISALYNVQCIQYIKANCSGK